MPPTAYMNQRPSPIRSKIPTASGSALSLEYATIRNAATTRICSTPRTTLPVVFLVVIAKTLGSRGFTDPSPLHGTQPPRQRRVPSLPGSRTSSEHRQDRHAPDGTLGASRGSDDGRRRRRGHLRAFPAPARHSLPHAVRRGRRGLRQPAQLP